MINASSGKYIYPGVCRMDYIRAYPFCGRLPLTTAMRVACYLGSQAFGHTALQSTAIRCVIQRRFRTACANGRSGLTPRIFVSETEAIAMIVNTDPKFNSAAFLASSGLGRHPITLKAKEAFFSQGQSADCVFYMQTGRAKLTVVSQRRQGGYHHLARRGRLRWRGVDCGRSGSAHGHCNRHHRMHGAADRSRRDDPRDA